MKIHYRDSVPFQKVSIDDFVPLLDDDDQYPIEFMENHSVIKLKEDEDAVFVGICDTNNLSLIENLRNFHKKRVVYYEIEKSELSEWLSEKLSNIDTKKTAEDIHLYADNRILIDKLASDAPTVNLVNSILIEGIRKEASDIHIEVDSEEMIFRYRIDGYLQTVHRFEKERFGEVSSRIKIMANLNIMERRLPQDGRITVHLDKDVFDIRVSIVPIVGGESIVLRLFNKKKTPLNIDQLGLDRDSLKLVRAMSRKTHGLILVTGPTGSGKTTSLNAFLREIRSERMKLITIEDPVEYVTNGLDQIQTNENIGLTFDSILRRVLRQDPDVIMVGEIRDTTTAQLAMRAALTGHLVFSTLHTKDSISVITRLKNMGMENYLIAAVLKGSIAQRLVRRICITCKQPYKPKKREQEILARYGLSSESLFYGKGCKRCNGTGYRGRTGIFELFIPDEELEEMIVKGKRESEIQAWLLSKGMRPITKDGLCKAVSGITTVEEVERVMEI
jgi:type II secretory ATPase GspE/PulE/Tfp pilus assembly ATPase PilB-like protein